MVIGVPKEVKDHETRVGLVPAGVTALREAGHEVLVETLAGEGSSLTDREYMQAGAHILNSAAEVWNEGRPGGEGERAAALRVRFLPARPDPVHLPAPGAAAGTHRSSAGRARQRRGLRNHPGSRWFPAPAHAHERSGRTHVRAGGRAIPGKAQRRPRHSARRRPGRGARQRGDPGRRHRGHQRGQDGAGPGRARHHHRSQPEPPARAGRYL